MAIATFDRHVWRPGATVFSAVAADGLEVVFWLLPQPSSTDPSIASLRASVQYSFMQQHVELPTKTRLLPSWWVFEPVCTANSCICGPRTLAEVLTVLPRCSAGQALAAHVDVMDAVAERIIRTEQLPPSLANLEHLDELYTIAAHLRDELGPVAERAGRRDRQLSARAS